jgi:Flp pilus assembly protein TadD
VSAPPIAARSEADVTPSSRPTDPKFYRERGAAFYHSGDLDRALADFSSAIALDPHSPSAYTDRSIVYYRKGEIALAFADLVEASRIEDSLEAAARAHRAGAAPPHK